MLYRRRKIMKASQIVYLVVALILFNCAPKAVKQTATTEYDEDLSALRPTVDPVEFTTDEGKEKAPYQAPSHNINGVMNSLIDSLAVDYRNRKIEIYTIQVYVGNSRDEANEVRTKVYKVMPDERPRLEYSQPNFRVKVGTYADRLEAQKPLTLLKKTFPGAILLTDKSYLSD